MALPPWLEEMQRWHERLWIAPEARPGARRERSVPSWLLVLAPYALVATAVAVLVVALALRQ
jgi:hypothetical protein